MARETEQKTILQVYVSSISAHEFLLGKIAAFTAVALAECALMLAVLFSYFGLRLAGDPTPFIVATLLYAFCVAAFGTMVGAIVPSQVAAMQVVALGGFLLVFLLSGLIFPIENIPAGLRWISNFVWGRYYIEIVRDALLQGGGWPAVWRNVVVIGIIGAVFYTIGWRGMRRMQLASRIAAVFDRYVLYRPDLIRAWELGRDGDAAWQPVLWRECVRGAPGAHLAARVDALVDVLSRRGAPSSGFPSRLSIFGVTTLAPLYLRAFAALAGRLDVHLFLLAPSREFMSGTVARKRTDRISSSGQLELVCVVRQ